MYSLQFNLEPYAKKPDKTVNSSEKFSWFGRVKIILKKKGFWQKASRVVQISNRKNTFKRDYDETCFAASLYVLRDRIVEIETAELFTTRC